MGSGVGRDLNQYGNCIASKVCLKCSALILKYDVVLDSKARYLS